MDGESITARRDSKSKRRITNDAVYINQRRFFYYATYMTALHKGYPFGRIAITLSSEEVWL